MNSGVLHRLRSRLSVWLALRLVLTLLVVIGAAALAAGLLDAALDLPEEVRVAAPWGLSACVLAALVVAAWQWRRHSEQRVARLFEKTVPALGNRLTNAVQLATQRGASAVEEFLRGEAVALGQKTAAMLKTWPVVRRSVHLATACAGAVALAWIGCLLLAGNLVQSVWPRFLDPHGDHPPFSRLKIDVTPTRAEVLYGGQVEIRATASGRPVDKLWLAAKSGTNASRTIMFLAPDKTFFQTLANLREPTQYFVTDGAARSRRFPIGIRTTPQITLVEVTTTFPDYTGKPVRTAKLSDEAQALPEGTRVAFRVASNRPLKSGALTLTPVLGGKPVEVVLQPVNDLFPSQLVTGAFTLSEPVVFTLSVHDVSGLEGTEPRRGRFNLLPDARPRLLVLEPGRDAVATPSIRVPVRVQATDDYGITRVAWLRGHNRSIERPFNMKITLKGGPQSIESAGAFELDKLGVRPGDVIEYYFEAADNYPKGPNVTLSRLYRLEIISTEQYEKILRMAAARKGLFQPYFQLGSWLRRLAERAQNLEKKTLAGSEADKETALKDGAALSADLEKYEKELGKLLHNPIMFDVEQTFRTALVAQHTRVGLTKQKLKKAVGRGLMDPKQIGDVAKELNELAQTEEDEVDQPARQIAAVAHVLARADTFVKLARAQATLAQMLQRFADNTNSLSRLEQMEVQELKDQQRHIQDGLRALLALLPELLAKVPAEPEYDPLRGDVNAFLKAVADAKIESDLSDAVKVLGELDAMTGYVLAQRAAEKMDKLISKCRSMPQQGQQCLTARFQPKLSPGLGNTLEQILAAMGANGEGNGEDGYGLFNDDVSLYGPNVELAGEQAGGREPDRAGQGPKAERLVGDGRDPDLPSVAAPGRVRLQPDAKFPLRYRDLVGEYFRAIAESAEEGEKK